MAYKVSQFAKWSAFRYTVGKCNKNTALWRRGWYHPLPPLSPRAAAPRETTRRPYFHAFILKADGLIHDTTAGGHHTSTTITDPRGSLVHDEGSRVNIGHVISNDSMSGRIKSSIRSDTRQLSIKKILFVKCFDFTLHRNSKLAVKLTNHNFENVLHQCECSTRERPRALPSQRRGEERRGSPPAVSDPASSQITIRYLERHMTEQIVQGNTFNGLLRVSK